MMVGMAPSTRRRKMVDSLSDSVQRATTMYDTIDRIEGSVRLVYARKKFLHFDRAYVKRHISFSKCLYLRSPDGLPQPCPFTSNLKRHPGNANARSLGIKGMFQLLKGIQRQVLATYPDGSGKQNRALLSRKMYKVFLCRRETQRGGGRRRRCPQYRQKKVFPTPPLLWQLSKEPWRKA
jgi:hypothetical protein